MAIDDITEPIMHMSLEEFLEWENAPLAEWVDGEVTIMTVSDRHQELVQFFSTLMQFCAQEHDLGTVRTEPYAMRLAVPPVLREPDVMFVTQIHSGLFTPSYLDGAADVIVEIVSPESRTRDTVTKRAEYERAGVAEYWIIDDERRTVTLLRLDEQGSYQPISQSLDGVYHSLILPGFWLRESWIWQRPLPKLMSVLREWNLI